MPAVASGPVDRAGTSAGPAVFPPRPLDANAPVPASSASPSALVDQDGEETDDTYDEAFGPLDSTDVDNAAMQADVATCVERWRNAGPESRKKMFALFAVTGVFVCLCRHGHPLVICDMIRSGELYDCSTTPVTSPDRLYTG